MNTFVSSIVSRAFLVSARVGGGVGYSNQSLSVLDHCIAAVDHITLEQRYILTAINAKDHFKKRGMVSSFPFSHRSCQN